MQPTTAKEAPEKPAHCATRKQLAQEFAVAVRLYSEAVTHLTGNASHAGHDYDQLSHNVREAYQRAEDAKVAFESRYQR